MGLIAAAVTVTWLSPEARAGSAKNPEDGRLPGVPE